MSIQQSFKGLYRLCFCGCGELISCINKKGQLSKFKTHHNLKRDRHKLTIGSLKKKGDYLLTYVPSHPKCHKSGHISLHRWIYEQYYNVCLLPYIDIHHKNGDTKDNRIENLIPITRSGHTIHHNKTTRVYTRKHTSDTRCSKCNKGSYKRKDGTFQWYRNKEGEFICLNCYDKYIRKKKKKLLLY
jgi:hypothetical protein